MAARAVTVPVKVVLLIATNQGESYTPGTVSDVRKDRHASVRDIPTLALTAVPTAELDALRDVARTATVVAAGEHVDAHEREQALDVLPHLLDQLAAETSTASDSLMPHVMVMRETAAEFAQHAEVPIALEDRP